MKIKVLGICGSPVKRGHTQTFLEAALQEAEKIEGVDTEFVALSARTIHDCDQCNWCLKGQSEGQFCEKKDGMSDIYPLVLRADSLLFASPVYFGRLSGLLGNFIDRLRVFMHGNLYRHSLNDKVGGALAVSWLRNGGGETTILSINYALWRLGMLTVGTGAIGVSNIGEKEPISKDSYGMKSAQALARRVVEVTKLIKLGKEASTKETI